VPQYLRLGAGDFKSRTPLSFKSVFHRSAVWWQFQERADREVSIQTVLLHMLQSGKFYPASQWVAPHQGTMNLDRAKAVWRVMVAPETVDAVDVNLIFFGGN